LTTTEAPCRRGLRRAVGPPAPVTIATRPWTAPFSISATLLLFAPVANQPVGCYARSVNRDESG
jgi:hypothetical protein